MKLLPWIIYIVMGTAHVCIISFVFPIHSWILFVLVVVVLIVIYLRGAITDSTKWIYIGVIVYCIYLFINNWLAPPKMELKDTDTYSYSSEELFDRK